MTKKPGGPAKPAARRPGKAGSPALKKQVSNRLFILAVLAALVIVAVAGVISYTIVKNRSTPSVPAEIVGAGEVQPLLQGIPQQNNALGQPNAPVTLIDYSDLKCPVCQRFSTSTLNDIINNYVRTGKVRIVFEYQTFVGQKTAPGDSERAARFGLAAGKQNKMWDFNEMFYHNQQPEDQAYASDEFLTAVGNQVPGLDVQQALSQMNSDAVTSQINDNKNAFVATGFNGVPSFQVGRTGQKMTNITSQSLDYSVFQNAIDPLL